MGKGWARTGRKRRDCCPPHKGFPGNHREGEELVGLSTDSPLRRAARQS
jgi:hypothetical protein